jgi:sialate O-acetylesterase
MKLYQWCWAACLVAMTSVSAFPQERGSLLAEVFSDHAVLQRDQAIRLFGRTKPGDGVTVAINKRSVKGVADESGAWSVTLQPMAAGGPHTLTVRAASGATQTVNDVLIGDLWLCSGQSNMEWPVSRTLNGDYEASRSMNDSIRLLAIAHDHTAAPRERFATPVVWAAAAPSSVASFSGTCYYFARELQKRVGVPMGLIHASWGGSNIETWISSSGLREIGGYDESISLLQEYATNPVAATARLGGMWEAWWRGKVPNREPWQPDATGPWREAPPALGNWKEWGIPALASFHGVIWYRRSVTLTKAQAGGPATLALGEIDEVDQTWVNGRPVGNTFGWGTERTYRLPAGVLREGTNVIVVGVLNNWAVGGLLGPVDKMALRLADGATVPLGDQWQYQVAPGDVGQPPRAPWESVGGMTTLYNAMIAPLGPIALRGALWYQGESNTGAADRYEKLLAGLMADWRRRFGADLPFLIVQLPNFGEPVPTPVESGWASLRDAQRRAVAGDRRAALAVTIDLGDRFELHPPDKQQVGIRLARAARHLVYGEPVTPSGPRVESIARTNGKLTVSFGDVEKALVAYSADHPIGFEVCGAAPGSCRFTSATLDGTRVVLDAGNSGGITRVRYCWGEAPLCNLYDASGLPASPFEMPIETAVTSVR